jgi:hypothetical protein
MNAAILRGGSPRLTRFGAESTSSSRGFTHSRTLFSTRLGVCFNSRHSSKGYGRDISEYATKNRPLVLRSHCVSKDRGWFTSAYKGD